MNAFPRELLIASAILLMTTAGCHSGAKIRDARYHELSNDFSYAQSLPPLTESVANPIAEEYSHPRSLDALISLGISQNPEILEARLRVESMANRVPQAAALSDPMMGVTLFPSPVQTAAGEQEFGLMMNQQIPWRGKLTTRAAIAEHAVNEARAQLAAIELKVIEQIKNAYFQLYFLQQAIEIIQTETQQLELIERVVDQRFRVDQAVSQQDLLQTQVARSQIETERLQFERQKKSTQAKLARLLHVSPETDFQAAHSPESEFTMGDIRLLFEMAIHDRPELHAQLAAIQQDRTASCLAELQSYPDVTVGFNWIATDSEGISPVANGDDAFLLTMAMNLPVYKRKIDAGVREAQTRALANAYKYDRLKDETMEAIADLVAQIHSLQETLTLFRDDIVPKQRLTLSQSIEDYRVGNVDFLQLIDNWRQLLRYEIAEKRWEAELQQAIASLARQLGRTELNDEQGGIVQPAMDPPEVD